MGNEVIEKNTIDMLPYEQQVKIVGNALFEGAKHVRIKRPATLPEVKKEWMPIVTEVIKRFASLFTASDFYDAFVAAGNLYITPCVEHYGTMSLEYAAALYNAWRVDKWTLAARAQRAREKTDEAEYNRWWEQDRLDRLTQVYCAIRDGKPISINPDSVLALHIEGRLESLGLPCRREERWKLPQLLTDQIKNKGLTLPDFLGGLAKRLNMRKK